jgi:NADH:ubiquinone oxidoreductase subunit 5 (subunit L)/multisubunit Na+/H+ antiporter MnhA subunit
LVINWDIHHWWLFSTLDYATLKETAIALTPILICIGFLLPLFWLLDLWKISTNTFVHLLLPDAMAGPTPVSALIHATMVTAGIFMITEIKLFI